MNIFFFGLSLQNSKLCTNKQKIIIKQKEEEKFKIQIFWGLNYAKCKSKLNSLTIFEGVKIQILM